MKTTLDNMKYILNKQQKILNSKFFSLALPIAFQNLLSSVVVFIDIAMISRLGSASIAAVGICSRWTFLINICIFGVCAGSAAFTSQYWGAREIKGIKSTYGISIFVVMVFSGLFCLAALIFPKEMLRIFTNDSEVISIGIPYLKIMGISWIALGIYSTTSIILRAMENVRLPLIAGVIATVFNILCNWIFIFGKFGISPMGAKGAALGSLMAFSLYALILIIFSLMKHPSLCKNIFSSFSKWEIEFVARFTKISLPALINIVFWGVGTNIYSIILARQGVDNYAAYSIFSSVEHVFRTFFSGMASACAILIGISIGGNNRDETILIAKQALVIIPSMSVIAGAIILFSHKFILRMMNIQDEQVLITASNLFKIYTAFLPIYMITYISIIGIFRASGDTSSGLIIDGVNLWLIGIPLTWILGMVVQAPFEYVFIGVMCESVLKCVMCLIRFRSRKWIKKIAL